MKRLQRTITILLTVLLFTMAMVTPVSAAPDGGGSGITTGDLNTGLYPEDKTNANSKRIFDRYPISNYMLVYVPEIKDKEDCGTFDFGCKVSRGLKEALFIMADIVWTDYMIIAKWLITVISWAFTMQVINYMFNAYTSALEGLQTTLWEPFMYLMWSVAVAWMVYYWISGKTTRLWSTLINSLIIIALSVTIMNSLPTFLQSLSNASTQTSVLILSGLSNSGKSTPSPDTNSSDSAMKELEDNLFNFGIVIPYKLVQFGSASLAQSSCKGKEFWAEVSSKGSSGDREKAVKDCYGAAGAEKSKYEWFTGEQVTQRLVFTILTFIASLVALICFVMIAFYTIMWQLIALGRGLLAAVYLLISLWPEYGMKEAAQWGWSLIQAMFMKVFYTIVLAVYINLVIALTTQAEKDNIGMLSIWLIALAIFIGLNQALKELRQKLTHIPLGNGMFLAGATSEGEDIGNKAAGAALMVAGAATGTGALIGAGLATQKGGLGGLAKTIGMGAVSKVGNATAGIKQKLVTDPLKKGASLAGSLVKKGTVGAGKGIKKGANWVDDALLHGKVKRGTATGVDAVKGAVNKGIGLVNRKTGLDKSTWRSIPMLNTDRLKPEDRQLMKTARETMGLDLATAAGRQEYLRRNPGKAEQIGKLEAHYNSSRRLAKELPRILPATNTPEYQELAVKYGAQNLGAITEARIQLSSAIKDNRQRPLKERVKPAAFSQTPRINKQSLEAKFDLIRQQNQGNITFEIPIESALESFDLTSGVKAEISTAFNDPGVQYDWTDIQNQLKTALEQQKQQTKSGLKPQRIRVHAKKGGQPVSESIDISQIQKALQTPSSNKTVANAQLQGIVNQWAKGLTGNVNPSANEMAKSMSNVKQQLDSAIRHLQQPGNTIDKYTGMDKLIKLMPELAGMSNINRIGYLEKKLGLSAGSGTPVERLQVISTVIGRGSSNLSSIIPPTPK